MNKKLLKLKRNYINWGSSEECMVDFVRAVFILELRGFKAPNDLENSCFLGTLSVTIVAMSGGFLP